MRLASIAVATLNPVAHQVKYVPGFSLEAIMQRQAFRILAYYIL